MKKSTEGQLGELSEQLLAQEAEEYELSKRTVKKLEKEAALFWEWLKVGRENGWISDPYCDRHDGIVMTDEEMENWPNEDECIFAIRLYEV
jgi:hypothetical protein